MRSAWCDTVFRLNFDDASVREREPLVAYRAPHERRAHANSPARVGLETGAVVGAYREVHPSQTSSGSRRERSPAGSMTAVTS
jgi:hypothetical protein